MYDVQHTIAAVASAPGGAARGVVRMSGPELVAKLSACFQPDDPSQSLFGVRRPRRLSGSLCLEADRGCPPLRIPGNLLLWPSVRSYTCEPCAEFHTLSSPPLLAAVVEQLSRVGIRPAEPGEFTLRAFLAGRIDLTQAEAVLGVIDSRDRRDLDAALDQLAGGLSRPLHHLREQLLGVLAELEAGLDFVEEDIEFIDRETLRTRLRDAQHVVASILEQLSTRDVAAEAPRVAITGPPNAGKSSLFNALVSRWGLDRRSRAIVSPQPGATRDYVAADLDLGGMRCQLIDTAGVSDTWHDEINVAGQRAASAQRRQADVCLSCIDATAVTSGQLPEMLRASGAVQVLVLTKADLLGAIPSEVAANAADIVYCSSVTGAGIDKLIECLRGRLTDVGREAGSAASAPSARCVGSLCTAQEALASALELTQHGDDELIAAEIRAALDALGEVVGAVCTDDVLDRVFSQFCIGK
jgi:tRNA modification GTPase